MKAALERRQLPVAVPIWELSFHLWNGFSRKRVVVGVEFAALTPAEQERALHVNAEVMAAVSEELCFAAVTTPGNYWEVAPGMPSYYWLPEDARWRQVELLVGALGEEVLLIGGAGGVISMPGPGNFLEFSYKLFDAPEEVDQQARRTLEAGLENAKRFLDLGVQGICTSSDIADNRGLFFSPPQMQRYVLPYLRTWARKVGALGGYSILHTDGKIAACLDELAGSGLTPSKPLTPWQKWIWQASKHRWGTGCAFAATSTADYC